MKISKSMKFSKNSIKRDIYKIKRIQSHVLDMFMFKALGKPTRWWWRKASVFLSAQHELTYQCVTGCTESSHFPLAVMFSTRRYYSPQGFWNLAWTFCPPSLSFSHPTCPKDQVWSLPCLFPNALPGSRPSYWNSHRAALTGFSQI